MIGRRLPIKRTDQPGAARGSVELVEAAADDRESALAVTASEEPQRTFIPMAELLPQPLATRSGYLSEDEAAAYLSARLPRRVSARTLRRWRSKKKGPKPSNGAFGRPIWYSQKSLEAWLETGEAAEYFANAA